MNVFHDQWTGRSLSLNHFRTKVVKEGMLKDTRGGGDPAMGEEAAIVGNAKRNGRSGQRVGSGWESSVDSVVTATPHVNEGIGPVRWG